MGEFEFRFKGDDIDFADAKETVEGWLTRFESAVSRLEDVAKQIGEEKINEATKD
tara:strand:- start:203 stop:367 length:165 start_codon:yes stop_codon:yes gene_type:complete